MRCKPLWRFRQVRSPAKQVQSRPFAVNELCGKLSEVTIDQFYNTSTASQRSFATSSSYDPLARRPNKICDPYGQKGKPLSRRQAEDLLDTLEKEWRLIPVKPNTPTGLVREFLHKDFVDGAKFLGTIAAVAQVNNHYPSILLERRLLPTSWQVVTRVECHTPTLEGLSYNDFHVAMLIDVESKRPDSRNLLLSGQQ